MTHWCQRNLDLDPWRQRSRSAGTLEGNEAPCRLHRALSRHPSGSPRAHPLRSRQLHATKHYSPVIAESLQPVCSPSAAHLQPLCSRSAAALAAACASVLEEEAEVVFGQLRQRRCISPHLRVDRVDWRGKSDFGAGVTAAPARGRLPWLHLPWLHLPWLHFPRLHLVLLPAHGAPQALIPWLYFTTAVLTMATLTLALLTNYGYTYHGCND